MEDDRTSELHDQIHPKSTRSARRLKATDSSGTATALCNSSRRRARRRRRRKGGDGRAGEDASCRRQRVSQPRRLQLNPTATSAPKAPVKKKEEGPKPVDAANHPLVKKPESTISVQLWSRQSSSLDSFRSESTRTRIVDVCDFLKRHPQTPFNYLSDLTCVHYPIEPKLPLKIVYNLYSIPANERVRLKVADDDGGVESVTGVWPAANWMEREVYDLFGVSFQKPSRSAPDYCCRRTGKVIRSGKMSRWSLSRTSGRSKHLPEMTECNVSSWNRGAPMDWKFFRCRKSA